MADNGRKAAAGSWRKGLAGVMGAVVLTALPIAAGEADPGKPQGGPGPMMEDVIDGTEITELTQDLFTEGEDRLVFTNKNYTLTEQVIIGDGDSLEIHRGAVLTIKDGRSLRVTGTGRLISNSQVFIQEGGSVSDEDAAVQGVFGEGYWRVMKNGALTLGGVRFASPDESDGAWARVRAWQKITVPISNL